MIRSLCILSILLVSGLSLHGQNDKYTKAAIKLYQAKDFDGARVQSDSSMSTKSAVNNPVAWNLRGFIYHHLSRTQQSREYRQEALEAFVKARELDKDGKVQPEPASSIEVVVNDYYKDVDTLMSSGKLKESKDAYLKYRELYQKYVDSAFDFHEMDVEYYSALGTLYKDRYEASKDTLIRDRLKNLALEVFHQVLSLDSTHFISLYNIGVIHYNQGVAMRIFISPDCDLECVRQVRDDSREVFRVARPYLERAYMANNKRPAIWQALASIYYELNERELFEKFDKMLQDLERSGN